MLAQAAKNGHWIVDIAQKGIVRGSYVSFRSAINVCYILNIFIRCVPVWENFHFI